jgi:hypothetical protein
MRFRFIAVHRVILTVLSFFAAIQIQENYSSAMKRRRKRKLRVWRLTTSEPTPFTFNPSINQLRVHCKQTVINPTSRRRLNQLKMGESKKYFSSLSGKKWFLKN